MTEIFEAGEPHLQLIRDIAYETWQQTYTAILSAEQIEYMFEWMYSVPSMKEQMQLKGHRFLIAGNTGEYSGFASFELNFPDSTRTKIHKLYVLPRAQGSGLGRELVNAVARIAKQNGSRFISLNVNRFNKATGFYKRLGFDIIAEEDIDIGRGYLMEDYVMEMPL